MFGMKRGLALAGVLAFGFAGAGCKKDAKAPEVRECSQAFITAYEDLAKELETTQKVYNDESVSTEDKYKQVERFQAACRKFFAQHRGVTCKARDLSDQQIKTIGASEADQSCGEADQILAQPAS